MKSLFFILIFALVQPALAETDERSHESSQIRPIDPLAAIYHHSVPQRLRRPLNNFHMINKDGEQAPGKDEKGNSLAFMGLIVDLNGRTHVGTVVNIGADNRLYTVGHNLRNFKAEPPSLFVIMYDRRGRKRILPVTDVKHHKSDPRGEDMAVIEIPQAHAEHLVSMSQEVGFLGPEEEGKVHPTGVQNVVIASMYPLSLSSYEELKQNYRATRGVTPFVFETQTGNASRTSQQWIDRRAVNPRTGETHVNLESAGKDNIHIFLEECDPPITIGNSGGVILNESCEKIAGFIQAYRELEAKEQEIRFWGNKQNEEPEVIGVGRSKIIVLGSSIYQLRESFPELFRRQ